MSLANSFPENMVTVVDEVLTTASQRVRALELQLTEASHFKQTLSNLVSFIRKDWPQHILFLLKKEQQSFEKLQERNGRVRSILLASASLPRSLKWGHIPFSFLVEKGIRARSFNISRGLGSGIGDLLKEHYGSKK